MDKTFRAPECVEGSGEGEGQTRVLVTGRWCHVESRLVQVDLQWDTQLGAMKDVGLEFR